MKKCLECDQVYDDETNFCLSDGSSLVYVSRSTPPDETPTIVKGPPAPTVFSGAAPFVLPISSPPQPEAQKSNTVWIALIVGFFTLVIGAAVVGLAVYGLFSSDQKENSNIANVSNFPDKSNKNSAAEQKAENADLARNLKEQQAKLDKDKQKLEEERKRLEAQKKETPTATPKPSSATTAVIIDPPSNVRATPNGTIICVLRRRGTVVNILGSTGVYDNNGVWYYTDVCGRQGVIHSTQIKF